MARRGSVPRARSNTYIQNTGGAVPSPSSVPGTGNYTVHADGTATLNLGGSYRGGVSANGLLAVFGGDTDDPMAQRLCILIKANNVSTEDTFLGQYTAVFLHADLPSGDHQSSTARFVAHGLNSNIGLGEASGVPGVTVENEEGTITSNAGSGDGATYEVDPPTGQLKITFANSNDQAIGAIARDGSFGFAAGATNPNRSC